MKRLILFLIAGIACSPAVSLACTCAFTTPLEQLDRSDAVFTAHVISVKSEMTPSGPLNSALVEVNKVWKGVDLLRVVVETTPRGSCSFTLLEGGSYLVYGLRSETGPNVFWTHECQRTTTVQLAEFDMKELGEPISVLTGPSTWGEIKAMYAGD